MGFTYKKSGVDITKAEKFLKKIGIRGGTHVKAFGALFNMGSVLKAYKNPFLVSSADGVGTKLKVAQQLNIHNGVGIDLVAMNVNDIICLGARPLFFLDYIACGKIKIPVLDKVVQGIKKGLRDAGCTLLGGETAEMPGMYKKDEYDLAGFCVGIVERSNIIDGRGITQGDLIIGLASNGLHSNGFSLVRKAFSPHLITRHAKELMRPTSIYVKPVLSLLSMRSSGGAVKGIAHITGGAFYKKATKILPQGLGMLICKRSWPVPKIFRVIQEQARIEDREMYSVFNMGIGMVLVVKKKYASQLLQKLRKNLRAYTIGEVIRSKEKLQWG